MISSSLKEKQKGKLFHRADSAGLLETGFESFIIKTLNKDPQLVGFSLIFSQTSYIS
jgi:hypothetical protein